MAIAIDSSTPALATANTGNVATTAGFTPPAGAVLAAFGWHDTAGGNTTNSSAVTDSQTSAWTIQGTRAKPDSGAQNGHVQVSTAVPAAAVATTVTTTGTSTGGSLAAGIYCAVLTGCDTTTPVDAIAEGSSASAVISQLLTTVPVDALVLLINCDWNVAATPTATAGETAIVGTGLGAGPDMRIWLVRLTALKNPAGAVTMASSAPTSGNTNNWVAIAFRPAAGGGGTQNATASLTETATLTAAAASDKPVTATSTVTASRTAAAATDKPITAALTGTATATAAAAATKPVDAALAVAATRTAAAASDKPVVAALTVTATLTAAASIGAAAVSIAGAPTFTATLTAAAAGVRPGASTVAVTAALTAAAATTKPTQAGLTITAALAASAAVVSSSSGLVGEAHGPLPRAPGVVVHGSVALGGTVGG